MMSTEAVSAHWRQARTRATGGRLLTFLLVMALALFCAAPVMAQPEHHGGEAADRPRHTAARHHQLNYC